MESNKIVANSTNTEATETKNKNPQKFRTFTKFKNVPILHN
jgi:hypothetical protein